MAQPARKKGSFKRMLILSVMVLETAVMAGTLTGGKTGEYLSHLYRVASARNSAHGHAQAHAQNACYQPAEPDLDCDGLDRVVAQIQAEGH